MTPTAKALVIYLVLALIVFAWMFKFGLPDQAEQGVVRHHC